MSHLKVTGNELQSVHDLSLLGREFCSLCCRGLAWWLRRWGGKYLLLWCMCDRASYMKMTKRTNLIQQLWFILIS